MRVLLFYFSTFIITSSASVCRDTGTGCASTKWMCKTYPYVYENCKKTCGLCTSGGSGGSSGSHGGTSGGSSGKSGGSGGKAVKGCQDLDDPKKCSVWKSHKLCGKHPWVIQKCNETCGVCSCQDFDDPTKCSAWKSQSLCGKNPWVIQKCKVTCGDCETPITLSPGCKGDKCVKTTCPDNKGIHRKNGEEWIDTFTIKKCFAKEDVHSSSWQTKIVACLNPANTVRFNVGTSITIGKTTFSCVQKANGWVSRTQKAAR